MIKPMYAHFFITHHEKYVLIAIPMLSRRMANTTIDSSGDAKIVGNNSVENLDVTKRRSGRSTPWRNNHTNKSEGSTDAVRSGYNDNSRMWRWSRYCTNRMTWSSSWIRHTSNVCSVSWCSGVHTERRTSCGSSYLMKQSLRMIVELMSSKHRDGK